MAQAKHNSNKRSQHGKAHAVNMGNVGSNIEKSEAGRKRKKAQQQAADKARREDREKLSLKEHVKLNQEFDFLSHDMDEMLAGNDRVYGLRVVKIFSDHSAFGILKMEVRKCGKNGLPSIVVTGSTFDPIPESENFLPIRTLRSPELRDVGQVASVLHWQRELHAALRYYLANEIKRMPPLAFQHVEMLPVQAPQFGTRTQRWGEHVTGPVTHVAHTAQQQEEDMVDVSGHKPFTALQFLTRHPEGVFTWKEGGHISYFRAERIAGVSAFVLIAVEGEGNPLAECLAFHEKVDAHVQNLSENDRPYGHMKEKKNAREKVRQYLRHIGTSLGVKPKQAPVPSNQACAA